jgi:hypothetical protein
MTTITIPVAFVMEACEKFLATIENKKEQDKKDFIEVYMKHGYFSFLKMKKVFYTREQAIEKFNEGYDVEGTGVYFAFRIKSLRQIKVENLLTFCQIAESNSVRYINLDIEDANILKNYL